VWDCDSYKISSPYGLDFGFIKDFWVDSKDDIMRFILEFIRIGNQRKVFTILSLRLFLRFTVHKD